MNAEELRDIYNTRFKHSTSKWTTADQRKPRATAKRIVRWITRLGFQCANPKMLDVGCADGNFTEAFRKLNFEAMGIDYSEIVLEHAKSKYPQCAFVHQNGFDPQLTGSYDLIFCRGFSGYNTHDLDFIASWANKYVALLSHQGFLVIGYSTDFSGQEKKNETVNHSSSEINALTTKVHATFHGVHYFHYLGWLSLVKNRVMTAIFSRKRKTEYYVIFQRNSS